MPTTVNIIRPTTDAEVDFKSPASEEIFKRAFKNALKELQDFIGSNGLGMLAGALDSDPPNTAPSYIVDTNPTVGELNFDNKFKGAYLTFTSGTASGQKFLVTGSTASTARIATAENLYAAGARSGDTYRMMGHRHTGSDSEVIDLTTIPSVTKEFDPRQRRHFMEEFLGIDGAAGTPFTTLDGWRYDGNNMNQETTVGPNEPGVMNWTSTGGGPQTNGVLYLDSANSMKPFKADKANFSFKAKIGAAVAPGTPGNGDASGGIALSSNITPVQANLAGYNGDQLQITMFSDNGTRTIRFRVVNAGTATSLTGAAYSVDTLYACEMLRTASGVFDCYINGTLQGTITATDPASLLSVQLFCVNDYVGSNHLIYGDYWNVSFDV